MSLSVKADSSLGAEAELMETLKVSRPTLRQAAKIAEADHMISVRRGIKGGYYAERPNAEDSIRTLAAYLRINGATLTDVSVVTSLVAEEAAVRAAVRCSLSLVEELRVFVTKIDDNDTPGDIVKAEIELARLIGRMSGNQTIQIVMEIGYTFGMGEHSLQLYACEEDRQRARALQKSLAESILAGDGELAQLMMRRRSAMFNEWFRREQGQDG